MFGSVPRNPHENVGARIKLKYEPTGSSFMVGQPLLGFGHVVQAGRKVHYRQAEPDTVRNFHVQRPVGIPVKEHIGALRWNINRIRFHHGKRPQTSLDDDQPIPHVILGEPQRLSGEVQASFRKV